MTEMYRFRSVKSLLGEHEELERQAIFFSAPEKLNDPMEGFRDIVWTGDRIVWVNLFRDYVNCLHWSFHHILVFGDEFRFEPSDVRSAPPWNAPPTPAAKELSYAIWVQVRDRAQIVQFAEKLEVIQWQARKAELTSYLRVVHIHALDTIRRTYVENGMISEQDWSDTSVAPINLNSLAEAFDLLEQLEGERFADEVFSVFDRGSAQNALIYKYNNRASGDSVAYLNKLDVIFHFPSLYVEQLNGLLWPDWYAACFTKNPNNSSMWAHYGSGHTGACLIFNAQETVHGLSIDLNQIIGWGGGRDGSARENWAFRPTPFYEVHYQEKPEEVDFYRTIGALPGKPLLDLWHTNESGMVSSAADHTMSAHDENQWREKYWDIFYRNIGFKTQDWAYEQEFRLVRYSLVGDFSKSKHRTLAYEFSSLSGIIFGIRTSDQDKQKIIEIVERKCRETNRTDFQFYQAYYSHEHGDIRYQPLLIRFAGLDDAVASI